MANKPSVKEQFLLDAAAAAGLSVEEYTTLVFGAVAESTDTAVRQAGQVASNQIVQSMTAEDKVVVKQVSLAEQEAEQFADH